MKETYKGCNITLTPVEDPESPRNWVRSTTMATWHRKYALGDVQPKASPAEYARKLGDHVLSLPLYLYDHSGLTIATKPFSCAWDSGQVGIIYCTLHDALRDYTKDPEGSWDTLVPDHSEGGKPVTLRERMLQIMQEEVRLYDAYLRGAIMEGRVETPYLDELYYSQECYPDKDGSYETTLREMRQAVDRWADATSGLRAELDPLVDKLQANRSALALLVWRAHEKINSVLKDEVIPLLK